MSENELTISYGSPLNFIGGALTLLLFPVWGIFGPLSALIVFLSAMPMLLFSSGSSGGEALLLLGLVPVSLSLTFVGIQCARISFDTALVVNRRGISFPLAFAGSLGWKRQVPWSSIKRVFISDGDDTAKTVVHLLLNNGTTASIPSSEIGSANLEKLLLCVEVWASADQKDARLAELLNSLHDSQARIGASSYTQMWEDELNTRFTSIAYVPLEPGHALQKGSLKIIRPLAFGGLSAIYLAGRTATGEQLVVKESVVAHLTDREAAEKATEMFHREARLLIAIDHPKIARVLDHFVEDDRNYLLMEHVPGEDLRKVVQQCGKQTESTVLDWSAQLAEIVVFLHSRVPPIVHRDITPDNVVLKQGKTIVLIDFGAANEFVGTATGTLVGKQAYISPEQFRGKTSTQSDIYAFGRTMYFLLTATDPEPLRQCDLRAVSSAEISDGICKLVADCTTFELKDRISDAQELSARIAALKTGDPKT